MKTDPRTKALDRLQDVARRRRELDADERAAIIAARTVQPPIPWREMGDAMGTTGQYLHRHFGPLLVTTVAVAPVDPGGDVPTGRQARRRQRA